MSEHEKLPLDGLHGPLPLSDGDFDTIRASVMSRIGRERRSPLAVLPLRLAAAALAVALIATLLVVRVRETAAPARPAGRSVASSQHVAATGPISPSAAAPAPVPTPVASKQIATRHRSHRVVEPPAAPVTAETHEPMTIELQTSNPDIRIIWITR